MPTCGANSAFTIVVFALIRLLFVRINSPSMPSVFIYIRSSFSDQDKNFRILARETWLKEMKKYNIPHLFTFNNPGNKTLTSALRAEQQIYGDILYFEHVKEKYKNIWAKTYYMYEWHLKNVGYNTVLMSMDVDGILFVNGFLKVLIENRVTLENERAMFGFCGCNYHWRSLLLPVPPHCSYANSEWNTMFHFKFRVNRTRTSNYYESWSNWPHENWPAYCFGVSQLHSPKAVPVMRHNMQILNHSWPRFSQLCCEDVITGLTAHYSRVRIYGDPYIFNTLSPPQGRWGGYDLWGSSHRCNKTGSRCATFHTHGLRDNEMIWKQYRTRNLE